MRRYSTLVVIAMLAFGSGAQAQTPAEASQARVNLTRANVKLDLTITDTYTGTPSKKTVSMLVLHNSSGMIRTSNRLPNGVPVGLNVDANVEVIDDDLVQVRVTFEYTPAQLPESEAERTPNPAELHESLTVMLKNGEPLVVSQSADPATDRTVTVELTATVLR